MSILKIKDSQGNWVGVPTVKGEKGNTGNGISSAILNDDYTLTLTFSDGTTYTTPSIRGEKGEQGDPASSMDIHICSSSEYDSETRIPTIAQPNNITFYLVPTEDGTSPDLFTEWVYVNNAWEMFGSASVDLSGYLTDVTVNGTSVVTDGVAEIPIASITNKGAVGINSDLGVVITAGGMLMTNLAGKSEIKQGTDVYKPIVSASAYSAAFYGLAKASGYDEKNSTLPVGQYTDEAKASIQNMLDVPSKSDIPVVNVDDVQINGSSIVSDGVANVPLGSNLKHGAVKGNIAYGINIASGEVRISGADSNLIKSGSTTSKALTPGKQHESAFYGLAKAAGDTTQSQSSNAVGQYTDNAKDSIQNMLGITPLIASHESDPFESAHVVGELFIVNGKLYRAKTALTVGEYVNEGTNVEVVSVAGVLDSKVSDVQVNGTSITENGVANIPYAAWNKVGVVQVNATRGTAMSGSTISTFPVDSATVKAGTQAYQPITPAHQHESVFYGLAKAAGDSTQVSSENEVGTYTDNAKSSIQSMLGVPSTDDVVNDVQLNGTSIISNGTANIPMATSSALGVCFANQNRGIAVRTASETDAGQLYTVRAYNSAIKLAAEEYRPIVPLTQHVAVFYGLAKLAGADMSTSSNEIGTYTDEAKTAIKQMLGVKDNYDSFIVDVDGTDPTITGQPSYRYNCGEVLSLTVTPPESGTIDFRFTSGSTPTVLTLPSTVKMPEWWVEVEANTVYEMCITDGVYCGVMTWAM